MNNGSELDERAGAGYQFKKQEYSGQCSGWIRKDRGACAANSKKGDGSGTSR